MWIFKGRHLGVRHDWGCEGPEAGAWMWWRKRLFGCVSLKQFLFRFGKSSFCGAKESIDVWKCPVVAENLQFAGDVRRLV